MPYEIGPRIKIDGEKEYRQQLNSIITQTKTLNAQARQMESAWGKDTSAKQKAAQQTQMLTKQIEAQRQKVQLNNQMLQQAAAKYGENDARTQKWAQAVANATTELNRLEAELRQVPNSMQLMGQRMQEVGQKVQTVGKTMTSIGSTLTRTVTAPIVAMGTAAVKVTADFDSAMSQVSAVSGATGADFDALRAKAREMGASTKFSATEAAQAMNYMAMAGWKTEDMLNGISGVMDLAAASGEDLATTSDIVTDSLTAFGKTAADSGKLADIMAAASSNANTNVSMMGETFKYAAPVAGALGFTMEDTALATGLMANAGIKASQAGTALRTGLTNLVKPTDQMKDAMNKYGIKVTNANGTMKSFRDIMKDLRKRLGGLNEAEQAAAAGAIFGKNAMSGWLAVINASDSDFEKLTTAIDNSDGTAKRMAETMQDNLAGQLTILKSQVQELGISFGDILVPKVRKAVEWLQNTVDKFNSMDEATKESIVKMAALAAAIGPVLVVGGKITTGVGKVIEVSGKLVETIGTVGGVMSALPIVATVGGIAALVGGLAALTVKFGENDTAQALFNSDLASTMSSAESVTSSLQKTTGSIQSMNEANDASLAKTEAAATLAGNYADELIALSNNSNRTATEQARMQALVSALNGLYPGLALSIDETTGKLNMSTTELRKNIKAMQDQARAMAYQKIYEKELDKLVELQEKVVEAEQKKAQVMEQSAEAENRQAQVLAEVQKEQDALTTATENYNKALQGGSQEKVTAAYEAMQAAQEAVNDGLVTINGELVNASTAMQGYASAQADADTQTREMAQAITEANTASAELESEMAIVQQKAMDLGATFGDTGTTSSEAAGSVDNLSAALGEAGDAASDSAGAITDANAEVAQSYDDVWSEAYKSVNDQKGLFQELKQDADVSLQSMAQALQSQTQAYNNWSENVNAVTSDSRYQTDMNFRAMADSIMNMGIDGAQYLQEFTTAAQTNDTALAGILADFGNNQEAKIAYATSMAEFKTATDEAVSSIQTGFEEAAPNVTKSVQELGKAAQSGIPGVSYAATLINSRINGINTNVVQQIPKLRTNGANMTKTTGDAIRSNNGVVNAAVNTVANTVTGLVTKVQNQRTPAQTAAKNVDASMASGFNSGKASVGSAATGVGKEAEKVATETKKNEKPAGTAAAGMATAVAINLSNKKSIVGQRAGQVASAASSPLSALSGQGYTWGAHLGQNFADGIRSKVAAAAAAARALANAGAAPIKHTTPKVGPMKDDDMWGIHFAENFIKGVRESIPLVARTSDMMAQAARSAFVDVGATSGRGVFTDLIAGSNNSAALDAAEMYEAVRSGARDAGIKLYIGERELGRVLRGMGVVFA